MVTELAFGAALYEVSKKLAEEALVKPALAKGLEPFQKWLTSGYDAAKADEELRNAFTAVIKEMGAPVDNGDQLSLWYRKTGLERLQGKGSSLIRRQMATALISFTDEKAPPPEDLMRALCWPKGRAFELSMLLTKLRAGLAGTSWKPLLDYANEAREKRLLEDILEQLSEWNNLVVFTEEGQALRVVIEEKGLTLDDAAKIEQLYRKDLIKELRWHNFRGIVQVKKDIRMLLEDIYLELGLLSLRDHDEQQKIQEKMLALDHEARVELEERRMEDRIDKGLLKSKRLVILGDPGTGKTMSLRFIALMLAYGYGAARFGFEQPYIPLMVRLADYAHELEEDPELSLDNYILNYIQKTHSSSKRLGEFLRLALEEGKCMLLLDGLDEVSTEMNLGKVPHAKIVNKICTFGDVWCDERSNRVIVTSRIEGYWNDPLSGFDHAQLSPLRPPDEVESFLMQWFTAHKQAHDRDLSCEEAAAKARKRVDELLPQILSTASVRRMAVNPLLLTILALIHDNLGKLPNRRITLYKIATQTLIESWRQVQAELPDALLVELGDEKIIKIMSSLAYWLHENYPGGTASAGMLKQELANILAREGFREDADTLARRFLYHARYHTGILAERSLDQYGFFHLTFEEYLAGRQMARRRTGVRHEMLVNHWADPRWQEVILLAAGQLGIEESREDDTSDFVMEILQMQPGKDEDNGRPALLAGRALADIGKRNVNLDTCECVQEALLQAAQDLDPDTQKPSQKAPVPPRVRVDCADLADELGHQVPDMHVFVLIPNAEKPAFMIGRYPVTNAQYARFLQKENFTNPQLWINLPKFSEPDKKTGLVKRLGDWGDAGWNWLQRQWKNDGIMYPDFWDSNQYGLSRPHAPVTGVSWYEANAYCRWLLAHWDGLPEGQQGLPKPYEIRLPTELEWVTAAGGEEDGRFAWGKLENEKDIICFANTYESGIKRTTPVWMYPQGESQPYHLMDLSGNMYEWQANNNVYGEPRRTRGGSCALRKGRARVSEGGNGFVTNDDGSILVGSDYFDGFRVVGLLSPHS